MVLDFYDRLKSRTQGYASLDYELIGYKESDLVKLDLLLNGESIDALSFIAHRQKIHQRARQLAEKMKTLIPKQMFEVAIQAAIGNRIIARETVSALKKNVTATEKEFRRFCHEKIAMYKNPKYFEFRDLLPKTPTGKIMKKVLKQEEFEKRRKEMEAVTDA